MLLIESYRRIRKVLQRIKNHKKNKSILLAIVILSLLLQICGIFVALLFLVLGALALGDLWEKSKGKVIISLIVATGIGGFIDNGLLETTEITIGSPVTKVDTLERRDCYRIVVEKREEQQYASIYGYGWLGAPKMFTRNLGKFNQESIDSACVIRLEKIKNSWVNVGNYYDQLTNKKISIDSNEITEELRYINVSDKIKTYDLVELHRKKRAVWKHKRHTKNKVSIILADGSKHEVGVYAVGERYRSDVSNAKDSVCKKEATSIIRDFSHMEYKACYDLAKQHIENVDEYVVCGNSVPYIYKDEIVASRPKWCNIHSTWYFEK